MVPKRNNNMNITQETAAEKNKKWEQLKKKGMEQVGCNHTKMNMIYCLINLRAILKNG